jgi:transposase
MMRTALYEAAQVLLTRTRTWSWLKALGPCRRRVGAAPRTRSSPGGRLGAILHRMWVDGMEFRWRKAADTAAA